MLKQNVLRDKERKLTLTPRSLRARSPRPVFTLVTSLNCPGASSPLPVPREQWEALSKDWARQVHPRKFSLSAGRRPPPTEQPPRAAGSDTAGRGSGLQAGRGLASKGRGPAHVRHTGRWLEGLCGQADWGLGLRKLSLTGSPCLGAPRVPVLGGGGRWTQTARLSFQMLLRCPARLLDAGQSTHPSPARSPCGRGRLHAMEGFPVG